VEGYESVGLMSSNFKRFGTESVLVNGDLQTVGLKSSFIMG